MAQEPFVLGAVQTERKDNYCLKEFAYKSVYTVTSSY